MLPRRAARIGRLLSTSSRSLFSIKSSLLIDHPPRTPASPSQTTISPENSPSQSTDRTPEGKTINKTEASPRIRKKSGPRPKSKEPQVLLPAAERINLPLQSQWREFFPPRGQVMKDRVSVRSPNAAAAIANAFVPSSGAREKIIIEAFPGPGALTRALMELPKNRIKKIIVLEDYEPYLNYLRPLEDIDSRVRVVPLGGFLWDTYKTIKEMGLMDDVLTEPWDNVHPQLQFISHLPQSVVGEQLVAQLFRSIPDKSWLFQYGRVPMSFILGDWIFQRISAGLSESTRCKLSVIAEAVAHTEQAVNPRVLTPYDAHFHPTTIKGPYWGAKPESRRAGTPLQAINITPLEHQVIGEGMLDKWDYCLRRLFVLKTHTLKNAISSLAPGADSLIKQLTNTKAPGRSVDVSTQIKNLTVADWALLIKAFDEWPFAPEDLLISGGFSRDERN